jgi:hypothetical protein
MKKEDNNLPPQAESAERERSAAENPNAFFREMQAELRSITLALIAIQNGIDQRKKVGIAPKTTPQISK